MELEDPSLMIEEGITDLENQATVSMEKGAVSIMMMMRIVVSGAFPLVRWERAGVGAVDERCFDTST